MKKIEFILICLMGLNINLTAQLFKADTISYIDNRTYSYIDTIIGKNNVLVQKNYRQTTNNETYLESIDFSYFNSNNIKYKEIRFGPEGDTLNTLLYNTDSTKGRIGELYLPGTKVSTSEPDTRCYKTILKEFTPAEKRDFESTAYKLLNENKDLISSSECLMMSYVCSSNDKSFSIRIKNIPDWNERKIRVWNITKMAADNSKDK